jgi:predicted RNA methylase
VGGQYGEEVENENIENEEVENEEVEIQASVEKTYKGKPKTPRSHSTAATKCGQYVLRHQKRYQRPHKALTPSRTMPLDHMAELAA